MDNFKNIRWRQRFQNLNKAFEQLQRGLAIKTPSDIEQQGIIQSFEFTFPDGHFKIPHLWPGQNPPATEY